MATVSTDFQNHIAEIYLTSFSADLRDFRRQALDALQWMLDFKAGCWGLASPDGINLHRCAESGLSATQFEQIAGQVPSWLAGAREEAEGSERLHEMNLSRFDRSIKNAGRLYWRDAEHGPLIFVVALYPRRPPDLPPRLSDALSALLLHVSTAYSHALLRSVATPGNRRQGDRQGIAVLDRQGYVYEANGLFWSVIEQAWPLDGGDRLTVDLIADGRPHTQRDVDLCYRCREVDGLLALCVWPSGPLDALTERELQIVYRVCRGLTYKEAARELDLAPSTIANRLYRVYEKLGIRGKPELVRMVRSRNVGSF